MCIDYTDYAAKWDEIASRFSKEAVLQGSFDKYADSARAKRGTAEVDDAFLKEIESWRDALAGNIALRNPALSQPEVNFAVQRTIDRIVFLRICEDRGTENYAQLLGLVAAPYVYRRLLGLFRQADDRYNSGLFHFHQEKGRAEAPDELTLALNIDDTPLRRIIKSVYYPDSPYEFSVLPADILGQVYEQFLGKVIRLTPGHQAKVEDKPEVKKAGGVYYTPTYIVDYIVSNTVGKLLEGRTPREAAKLRVLDPACGSGSFLIAAYQFLLDWHAEWYSLNDPEKWAKSKPPRVHSDRSGWRLTNAERRRILLNSIYGVDIDSQAVEVTKLSLLLKILEGQSQLELGAQRMLPDLGGNIKCGNSLIGPDFYSSPQAADLDAATRLRVNAFDWHAEFPDIMKAGGFDAVIGNPPWGATFSDAELAYLRTRYARVVARMVNSYIYFVDCVLHMSKQRSLVGLIVPATVLNQVDARPVRELLLARQMHAVVNLGRGIFGSRVLNTSAILIAGKAVASDEVAVQTVESRLPSDRVAALAATEHRPRSEWTCAVRGDPHFTFFSGGASGAALLQRLRLAYAPLLAALQQGIQRGVSPDTVAAHVMSPDAAATAGLDHDLLRLSVSGSQIARYRDWIPDQYILYTTRGTDLEEHPNARRWLQSYRHLNSCREVAEGKHPWWALHRPRDPSIFAAPKFIGLTTSKTIELIYDAARGVYVD